MDEGAFVDLAAATFRTIGDALDSVDSDFVDIDSAGDVVTLTICRTQKCIVNTQRVARQIWLAAHAKAWHFSWDPSVQKWMDDRGGGEELLTTISRIIRDSSGISLVIDSVDGRAGVFARS
jgi:CyaY protein